MTAEMAEPDNKEPPAGGLLPRKRGTAASWAWLFARIGLSLAVLAIAWTQIDVSALTREPPQIEYPLLITAMIVLAATLVTAALRWSYLSKPAAPITWRAAIAMTFGAQFVGQVLPSSLGQDAVRAFLATRGPNSASDTLSIIVLDRLCGMIGLSTLILLGLPRLIELAGVIHGREAALLAGGFAAIALLGALTVRLVPPPSFLPAVVRKLWDAGQRAARMLTSAKGAVAVGLSVIVHSLVALSLWLILRSLGAALAPADALATIPAAMFVAIMPISVNGWGVREGAMVVSLGFAGVIAAQAFFASILFGISQFLLSLPGALALISLRRRP